MRISGVPQIIDFDPFSKGAQSGQALTLGEAIRLDDSRIFRFAQNGAATVSPGKVSTAPVQKTNHHGCVAIASVAGTFTPTFTLGATAVVANEYNEGFISINITPDVGRTYKVSSLGAVVLSGTANPTLFDPIVTAWTTATRVSLIHNRWAGLVEGTAITVRPAGVPMISLLTTELGWVQTRGVAAVLCDTASTLGAPQICGAVAGSVKDQTDNLGASAELQVALCDIMAGVDTTYRPMSLIID